MPTYIRFLSVAIVLCATAIFSDSIFAMGGGGNGGGGSSGSGWDAKLANPDYLAAQKALRSKDWNKAIELLNTVLMRDDRDPDIYTDLGVAERNLGNVDAALKNYEKALALDPRHLGANANAGETYLMMGNVAKAEEYLATLDRVCFLPCLEYSELKQKVAEYKDKHP